MTRIYTICFTLLLHGLSLAYAQTPNQVEFPQVGLSISPPAGFVEASSFHGFQQDSSGASIVLASLPAPYPEVSKGFTQAGLASQGMNLLSANSVDIQAGEGRLFSVSQEAYGILYQKWLLAFGDDKLTYLVTASFPASSADTLSASLKDSVLSVRAIAVAAAMDDPGFTLTPADGLKKTTVPGSLGKLLAFTQSGSFPVESQDEAIFIAAPSMGQININDAKAYAVERIQKTAGITNIDIESVSNLTVDGLSGVEIIANAAHDKTQMQLLVYQVMLFKNQGGYLLMTARAPNIVRHAYLPSFQATAKSYQSTSQQ